MIILGEDFQASSVNATVVTDLTRGAQLLEGEAPNRAFQVKVHNRGANNATIRAQESADGSTWTAATNRAAGVQAGIVGLVGQAEGDFDFIVGPGMSYWRLVGLGVTDLTLKLEAIQRAPMNV